MEETLKLHGSQIIWLLILPRTHIKKIRPSDLLKAFGYIKRGVKSKKIGKGPI